MVGFSWILESWFLVMTIGKGRYLRFLIWMVVIGDKIDLWKNNAWKRPTICQLVDCILNLNL